MTIRTDLCEVQWVCANPRCGGQFGVHAQIRPAVARQEKSRRRLSSVRAAPCSRGVHIMLRLQRLPAGDPSTDGPRGISGTAAGTGRQSSAGAVLKVRNERSGHCTLLQTMSRSRRCAISAATPERSREDAASVKGITRTPARANPHSIRALMHLLRGSDTCLPDHRPHQRWRAEAHAGNWQAQSLGVAASPGLSRWLSDALLELQCRKKHPRGVSTCQ